MAVAYTFALSLVTAVVFGAIPLWRSIVIPPKLNEGGRGNTASRSRHRARHLLMGGQVALALILLIASGLVARSFQKIRATRSWLQSGVSHHVQHRVAGRHVPDARLGGRRA